jgi:hypothetical protein
MSGVRGNPQTLREFSKRLRQLPIVLGERIARKAAPVIQAKIQEAYHSGTDVYGVARPAGKSGSLDLVQTSATVGSIGVAALGTKIRSKLGPRYAKYIVGKYRVLPMGAIPVSWQEELARITRAEIVAYVMEGGG